MHQQFETLQQQLKVIKYFEKLFDTNQPAQFTRNLGTASQEGSFLNVMLPMGPAGYALAFQKVSIEPVFNFSKAIDALKPLLLPQNKDAILKILESQNEELRIYEFFNQLFIQVGNYADSDKDTQNKISSLYFFTKKIIAKQKTAVQAAIEAARQAKIPASAEKLKRFVKHKVAKANPQIKAAVDEFNDFKKAKAIAESYSKQVATTQFRRKIARYTGAATLATAGTGAIAFSSLMQFSPQFVLLAGLHLPPVALAFVAVSGVAMLAAGAYVAYRTYKPATTRGADDADAAVNPNPVVGYSKVLTTALIASGLHLTAFSAMVYFAPTLMQFSPSFALLMGLHLSPVALLSIAAVGVLLLSVGLYRACKAYAQSRPDAAPAPVVATDADVQPSPTCLQRLSQYSASCFKFRCGTPAEDETPEEEGVALTTSVRSFKF